MIKPPPSLKERLIMDTKLIPEPEKVAVPVCHDEIVGLDQSSWLAFEDIGEKKELKCDQNSARMIWFVTKSDQRDRFQDPPWHPSSRQSCCY
tara:strand:+ start:2484 stop:2759 length:276 start_codon:yes stop_codon:yes gene_type:complete